MDFVAQLNDPSRTKRLLALGSLLEEERCGKIPEPKAGDFVNNHIHTTYSFSPYSPTAAVWHARAAGLCTAGIMDHDSVGGFLEFCEAGALCNMPVTCGIEMRVSLAGTPFARLRTNNPDQEGICYLACHGVPRNRVARAEVFLAPLREARNLRNRKMLDNINSIFASVGVALDFDADVVPLSRSAEGGSITERHLLFAVSLALVSAFSKQGALVGVLQDKLGLSLSEKQKAQLSDPGNPYYEYDLLGILKGSFVKQFYIPATDELSTPREFVAFCHEIGAIAAYPYLGDVGDSVTGDKVAAKYEDSFLDELFRYIKRTGFDAVSYMPSRNTPEQLSRIMALCSEYGMLQISGEDINSPRQSFICPALERPEYAHLKTATWALIGHEQAATADISDSICGKKAAADYPDVTARIEHYAKLGRGEI